MDTRTNRRWLRLRGLIIGTALWAVPAHAQSSNEMREILQRLERLEQQNRELAAEVRSLRQELASSRSQQAPPAPALEERVEVQESRVAEQAQTKVEAAHRFPIRLTGMALFNAYFNSKHSGGFQYPTIASPGRLGSGGATLRQSIIGLDYSGPTTAWNGKITGALRIDLFGGSGQSLDQELRLRTGTIAIDWKTRSIRAGVDKPIISPREPDSLAQVGISPLTGAGNLWLWLPQVRFEQDFHIGEQTGFRAQIGAIQTRESGTSAPSPYGPAQSVSGFEPARPGVEARLEWFAGTNRRIEIASGIHRSVSHVGGTSVPSEIISLDWLLRPVQPVEFTGTFFSGENVTPLGTGFIRQGFVLSRSGDSYGVRSRGGWGQLTWRADPRLWFNVFSGQHDDRNSQLRAGAIGKNFVYGANVFYRLAPNVLASLEASQTRTSYIATGTLLTNHYDLALAYLF